MRTFQRVARLIRPSVALPVLALLALAGMVLMSQGCNGVFPVDTTLVNPSLSDVPVPMDSVFNANESYQRTLAGGFRNVRHFYDQKWPIPTIAEYYRKHMPEFGWTLREENLSGGTRRYTYDKESNTCYISIWDNWGTKLLVQVMPKGTAPSDVGPRPAGARPAGR